MKTYVFIIRRICNITGAQQYVYNKLRYLESNGWRVLIFSSLHGKILIHEFERFKNNIIPSLYLSPVCFRNSEVEYTINRIIKEVGNIDGAECIVESDSFQRAIWAEMVASRLKGRHLAFFMQQKHSYDDKMKDFLMFKYKRHELAVINNALINQMLGNVEQREDTKISAYCNNVIDDCEDHYSNLLDESADYTLGSLGRLDKGCVPGIVDGLCSYVNSYPSKKFNIVMIGDALIKGREKTIRKKLNLCNNVHLVMTGNVYPVPSSFLKNIDVMVSTAGAAVATYLAGVPTITVHPKSGEPIGVIGLDYEIGTKSMYDPGCGFTIDKCIDRAIKERTNIVFSGNLGEEYIQNMNKEFNRQLSFVKIAETNEYYDENLLRKMKAPNQYGYFKPWLLGHIFGGNGFSLVWKITRKH